MLGPSFLTPLTLIDRSPSDGSPFSCRCVCLCLSLSKNRLQQEPYNLCVYMRLIQFTHNYVYLLMASLSAGVGGYSLSFFLYYYLPFFDISWTFFPFFFFLSLLVFSPYFLSSCWLPHILFFSILICVSLFLFTVFFSFSSNIIFECYVSRFCIFLLFSLFILPSGGLVGGFLGSPHQSVFRMADSACATHAPSLLRLSNNPSPPPLVQHGRIHICHEWLHVVRCV